MHRHDSRILPIALRGNATFSAISGLAFALASTPLSAWAGLDDPRWLVGVGVVLLAFAAHLAWAAGRGVDRRELLYFAASDLGWIVGSGVLILGFPGALSTEGRVGLALLSLPVAILATLQSVVLLSPATEPRPQPASVSGLGRS